MLRLLDGLDLKRLPSWAAGDHDPANPTVHQLRPNARSGFPGVLERAARGSRRLRSATSASKTTRSRKSGIYLQVVRWEKFLDAMSETRLQDEYNESVSNADIFVSLFATKAGPFTEEEFGVAWPRSGEPAGSRASTRISSKSRSGSARRIGGTEIALGVSGQAQAARALLDEYKSAEHLKRHFSDQLRDFVSRGEGDGRQVPMGYGVNIQWCSTTDAYVAAGLPGERP